MSEQIKQQDLLQLIRATLKSKQTKTTTQPTILTRAAKARPTTATKTQPRKDVHGKLGDFTRSNSNPPTRTNNTAIVGYEEVPKTRLSIKHDKSLKGIAKQANGARDDNSLAAETEMIRKAIKLVLNQTGGAPSKAAVKRAAAPKMTKSDRVFQAGKGCGVGSSRSVTLGIIKAIAHPETGCIVREQNISASASAKNANTTQGNYNPMIVE